MRAKIPALREALEGRFEPLHALLIEAILAHIDFLEEQIQRISDAIEEQLAPFAPAIELLCTSPGIQRRTAENIVAEIGLDMSVFPTAGHPASWAGQCPGNDQSAGKRRSGRTRKGSKWLDDALKDAALAAIRTDGSYLQALYRRKKPQLGHGRAIGATRHDILIAYYHIVGERVPFRELGPDWLARRHSVEHRTRRLLRQLEALGHTVTIEAAA